MHLVGGAPGNASAYVTGFDQASFMIGTVSSLFNVRPPPLRCTATDRRSRQIALNSLRAEDVNDGFDAGPRCPTTSPPAHPPRLPLTSSTRPGINLPPGTVWTGSGPGPDRSRRSLTVPVPVPEISSGTGLSGLRSRKNGPGPDQTELPQHYQEQDEHCLVMEMFTNVVISLSLSS